MPAHGIIVSMMMTFIHIQTAVAQQDEMPSLEFLEFLGEGVQVENEIIDPMGYSEIEKMTGDAEQQPEQEKADE